jgi:hypothetical protein
VRSSVERKSIEMYTGLWQAFSLEGWEGSVMSLVVRLYRAGARAVKVVDVGTGPYASAYDTFSPIDTLNDPQMTHLFEVYYTGRLNQPV